MTDISSELGSKLGKVRGLGSAHHGVGHWWAQRVTAVAMIPLSLWFVTSLMMGLLSPDVLKVASWFSSPVNTVLLVGLLVAVFYHAKLGVQVVIEDYVKSPFKKYGLLMASNFLCFLFAAISILAVLKLHFLDVAANM